MKANQIVTFITIKGNVLNLQYCNNEKNLIWLLSLV